MSTERTLTARTWADLGVRARLAAGLWLAMFAAMLLPREASDIAVRLCLLLDELHTRYYPRKRS